MYSENSGQIFKKIIALNEIGKKNKPCGKFCWVNQDLFSQGKNNELEIKPK